MKSIYFGASRFPLSRPSHSFFFFVFSNSNAFLVSPTFHVRPVTGIYIYIACTQPAFLISPTLQTFARSSGRQNVNRMYTSNLCMLCTLIYIYSSEFFIPNHSLIGARFCWRANSSMAKRSKFILLLFFFFSLPQRVIFTVTYRDIANRLRHRYSMSFRLMMFEENYH